MQGDCFWERHPETGGEEAGVNIGWGHSVVKLQQRPQPILQGWFFGADPD